MKKVMREHRVTAEGGPEAGDVPIVQEDRPPPYDKKGNGDIESAIKTFSGHYRTLKLCLEKKF